MRESLRGNDNIVKRFHKERIAQSLYYTCWGQRRPKVNEFMEAGRGQVYACLRITRLPQRQTRQRTEADVSRLPVNLHLNSPASASCLANIENQSIAIQIAVQLPLNGDADCGELSHQSIHRLSQHSSPQRAPDAQERIRNKQAMHIVETPLYCGLSGLF
jgi:hypothetical protein